MWGRVVAAGLPALAAVLVVGLTVGAAVGFLAGRGLGTTEHNSEEVSDRAALIEFVKMHALDPTDLEIIELSTQAKGTGGVAYTRTMVIRCKLIDFTNPAVQQPFGKLDPKPLSQDSGTIYYSPDGKVCGIQLDGCGRMWGSPSDRPLFRNPIHP
jgi:hypothetical protein